MVFSVGILQFLVVGDSMVGNLIDVEEMLCFLGLCMMNLVLIGSYLMVGICEMIKWVYVVMGVCNVLIVYFFDLWGCKIDFQVIVRVVLLSELSDYVKLVDSNIYFEYFKYMINLGWIGFYVQDFW